MHLLLLGLLHLEYGARTGEDRTEGSSPGHGARGESPLLRLDLILPLELPHITDLQSSLGNTFLNTFLDNKPKT